MIKRGVKVKHINGDKTIYTVESVKVSVKTITLKGYGDTAFFSDCFELVEETEAVSMEKCKCSDDCFCVSPERCKCYCLEDEIKNEVLAVKDWDALLKHLVVRQDLAKALIDIKVLDELVRNSLSKSCPGCEWVPDITKEH